MKIQGISQQVKVKEIGKLRVCFRDYELLVFKFNPKSG